MSERVRAFFSYTYPTKGGALFFVKASDCKARRDALLREKSIGDFRRYGVSGFSLTSCGALWALLAGNRLYYRKTGQTARFFH